MHIRKIILLKNTLIRPQVQSFVFVLHLLGNLKEKIKWHQSPFPPRLPPPFKPDYPRNRSTAPHFHPLLQSLTPYIYPPISSFKLIETETETASSRIQWAFIRVTIQDVVSLFNLEPGDNSGSGLRPQVRLTDFHSSFRSPYIHLSASPFQKPSPPFDRFPL